MASTTTEQFISPSNRRDDSVAIGEFSDDVVLDGGDLRSTVPEDGVYIPDMAGEGETV